MQKISIVELAYILGNFLFQLHTLIPCRLFSTLSFAAVQVKPKCYETTQNMEDTYHSEMFFFTWENY